MRFNTLGTLKPPTKEKPLNQGLLRVLGRRSYVQASGAEDILKPTLNS